MKQQYKKVPNSWQYIRRFDEPEKTISEKSINILAVAMYQINKHDQAILTHKALKEITGRKHDQNRRLIKQLGFIFHFKFSRFLIESNKKYNDAYQLTLKKSALEILQNPEKYFANYTKNIAAKHGSKNILTSQQNNIEDRSRNAVTSQQKCSDVAAKMPRSHDLLHIYNKNKDKINNKINNKINDLNNLSSSSIEKSVETIEPRIANSEYVETPSNGLAKEEFVYTTQAKMSAKENAEEDTHRQETTPFANQKQSVQERDVGEYYPTLLKNYPLTDQLIQEIISKSSKPHYTTGTVRLIVRNILENAPNKPVYGGKAGLLKYLVQAINNHVEYDNSDYTTNIFFKKNLTPEEQRQVDESWTSGKIRWLPC